MGDFVDCPGLFGPTEPGGEVTPVGETVVTVGAIVAPGVKPGIPVVVVALIVVVVVLVDVVLLLSDVTSPTTVVVVVGGAFTTLTASE